MPPKPLFGGAIIADFPTDLLDASDIREVPDSQEVFLYRSSSVSIIVEILQGVDEADPLSAARFHFDSLATDNAASSNEVHGIIIIPNDRGDDTPSPIVLSGTQFIPKFNHTIPDEVRILLALYRVKDKGVDLVLTWNVPVKAVDSGAVGEEEFLKVKKDFDVAAISLRILEFDLFA
ncbi:hypothetical protein JAAARDRAFT_205498 [Jaapia argillacea MUCL 33604]|uniref:Mog1p/PsbP-like protein n=1 Tax=Jaapia argillacea MUCL 33604 TaxID=933084 RepID=A0A067PXP6_9AGAM|nr:hypothetical protein JAAARDRAFT_205498 [Jaapia argillacea MUCL 33604]